MPDPRPTRRFTFHPARVLAIAAAIVAIVGTSLRSQSAAAAVESDRAIRVGLRARSGGASRLTSLRYIGGFETKTLILETLVRRAPDGRIVGALAADWSIADDGREFRFRLRPDARFHDGTPVTGSDVAAHFRRWFGHVEHDWLAVNRRIVGVEATGPDTFVVRLDRPYALLEDLVAINPCSIVAPASNDWEGEFVRPIGTGPFRFVSAADDGKRWQLRAVASDTPRLEIGFYPRGRDDTPIDDLIAGRIDLFVGGWDEDLPADRLTEIEQDARFQLDTAPGSSVVYLSFRMSEGPSAERALRARIGAAIDRHELIRIVEGGRADPCTTWAAPSVGFWPAGPATAQFRKRERVPPTAVHDITAEPSGDEITVSGGRGGRAARVAIEVVAQLRRAGIRARYLAPPPALPEHARIVIDGESAVRPLTTESGEVRAELGRRARERSVRADVRVEITHGMPYCPHQSLVARFGSKTDEQRAQPEVAVELRDLVDAAAAIPSEGDRIEQYLRIQSLMDREVLIVPLYSPWRVALRTAAVDGVALSPDVYRVGLESLRWVRSR
jgi:ABC-type transport system substrate-binding protein